MSIISNSVKFESYISGNLVLIEKGETGQEILKKLGKNDDVNIYSQLSSENYEFAKEGLRKVLEIKETNKKCQNKDK